MIKNLIDFFIAISFLLPQSLSFAVGLLEFLQRKPHIINIGFIKSVISKLDLKRISEILKLWQSIGSLDWDLVLR